MVTTNNKFFFVHIPKTAGTSFRKSLESFFGSSKVLYDYGAESVDTSKTIINYFYSNKVDPYSFFKEMDNYCTISGHVNITKYLPFSPVSQIVTFVREPIEQVVSHYNHYITHHNYKDSFQNLVENPNIHNRQTQMLTGVPLELIGFIGITEYYDQSIKLINHQYQLNLKILRLNERQTTLPINLEDISRTKDLIINDQQLYNKAKKILKERLRMFKAKQPWVYGFSNINSNNIVHGVAYYSNSDDPVTLDIYLDGEQVGSTEACRFSKTWSFLQLPRASFVGYQFPLPQNTKAEQEVTVVVRNTGQCISYDKLKTKKVVAA